MTRKAAKKELDRVFSMWVRLSHSKDGYVSCFTCGKVERWDDGRKMNAGHFMVRNKMSTRWHPDNVKPQCSFRCNKMLQGNQYVFAKNLDKLRPGLADEMVALSNTTRKWTLDEIKEEIAKYKALIADLKREA